MKNTHIIGIALAAMAVAGCQDVLDEQPRSSYDPSFFQTEKGIKGGLTALYSSLRQIYGDGYYFNGMETGTDEYTYGKDGGQAQCDKQDLTVDQPINPNDCPNGRLWGLAFTYINTASGILENGEEAGMDPAMLAEANFFRAFYYFNLVQTFGGVPLDLGSGELKMNVSQVRTSVRNTVPEVYTRAIFPDLKAGVANLPDNPRLVGTATKHLARFFLAKAYLTYGWWLENPKNIPTYPECGHTDPDGHDASWYFNEAYKVALEVLKNPAPYALQPTYYDVTRASNDRNSECMLWADHTSSSEKFDGQSWGYTNPDGPANGASWFPAWSYDNTGALDEKGEYKGVVPRQAIQQLGRPWSRMAPSQDVFTKYFTETDKDSRADGTFTLQFKNLCGATVKAATGLVAPGETFLRFIIDPAVDCSAIDYDGAYDGGIPGANGWGFGALEGYKEFVCPVTAINTFRFPMLYKQGPQWPDNSVAVERKNGGSPRPMVIAKLSELYLIAAEAAVKGATTEGGYSARELVNVLRARAGKWTYCMNDDQARVADFSQELTEATPQDITLDYVLDERLRELYGEYLRWFDLVRTQTWEERAGTYTMCRGTANTVEPQTFTRKITPKHYLRPIPQGQIDALEMSDAEKEAFQNPRYW